MKWVDRNALEAKSEPVDASPPQALTGAPSGRFARNSAFGTVAGIGTALASLLSGVIVARLLGVEGSGAVAFALWIITFVGTFATLGTNSSLARYLPELSARGEQKQSRQLTALLIKPVAVVSILTVLGFAVYAGLHGSDENAHSVRWLIVGIASAAQALSAFALGYLRGVQRFDRAATLTLASLAVQLLAVAAGSVLFGISGALAGYCLGAVLPAAMALRFIFGKTELPQDLRQRVFRYSRFAWAGAIAAALIWSRVEVFFLERSWGHESVGLFAAGLTLANLAAQGPALFTGGLLPYFSECFGRNALGDIRAAYATAMRVMSFLVLPACFGGAAMMPLVIPLIYGNAFAGAIPVATILMATASFAAIASVGSALVYGLDRSDFIFLSGWVGVVLSVLAGFTLIPMFGAVGAAWARGGIQIIMIFFGTWFINARLKCPTPFGDLARLLIASLICAATARICVILLPGIGGLVLAIIAGAVTYFAAVRLLKALPEGDVKRLKSFCSRLPKPLRLPSLVGLRVIFGG